MRPVPCLISFWRRNMRSRYNDLVIKVTDRLITVFGGTGFLGRRIVRHLRAHEFSVRNASRHPDRSIKLFASENERLESIACDVHDERSVAQACEGAYGVVNAVSLYV